MKWRIFGLLILILITPRLSHSFSNEPDGFRGIKFGQSADTVKDLVELPSYTDDSRKKCYERKGDAKSIGDAEIRRITYCFWDNSFWYASGESIVKYEELIEPFILTFGPPKFEFSSNQMGRKHLWVGKNAWVEVRSKNMEKGSLVGDFRIESLILKKKILKSKGWF